MKTSGFNASTLGDRGGTSLSRKACIVFLIMAMMLAALPVSSVFAAPARQGGGPGGNNNLEQSWANKLSQLQAEVWFFNNFQTKPGQNRNNANAGQYLDKYRAALATAQSLVVSGSGFDSNGRVTNQNQAKQSVQQLGQYLSTIRGLKDKIGQAGGNNNNANNNGGNNAGIPVTGGAASNAGQNSAQNNNQISSPAKTWGAQFRQLQAAQTWFNNFHTKPGKDRNSEQTSRYLDQYAFALRAAYAIIANGDPNSGTQLNTNNNANGQGTSLTRFNGKQQLAMYLSMMRGLREKIAGGGNNNNNGGGSATP